EPDFAQSKTVRKFALEVPIAVLTKACVSVRVLPLVSPSSKPSVMASEEMKVEAPLYDQFLELSQRSEELLDRRGTLSDKSEVVDVAKGCMDVAKKLEDLIAAIDKLRLYSENEQLDDIATKDLRILKASAYLGLLLINGSDSNRLDCLGKAIFFLKQYLTILKKFDIFNDPDADSLLVDSPDENEGSQRLHKDLLDVMRERDRRVKRYKDQSLLKQRLEKANIRQAMESNEEELREIYLDELRLYGYRALEELSLAKQEYQILKERETMNVKERVADDTPAGHPSGGLNMLVISRDGMKKNVFGAGYPSVPSQSIDDWLKRRDLKEKRAETEFADSSVVESFKPGADKKTVTFAEEPKSNSNSDSDDESKLASKREWDEYKDTHPRGWGNTYNKG
ncbi:hypothetical protein M513_10892, partial [Trichuris suis]